MTPNALVLTGRVTRADVPGLCARLEALLRIRPQAADPPVAVRVIDCDVGGVIRPDLALVEAVARLGLVARRAGGVELRLRNVPAEVGTLLELVGLAGVVGDVRPRPD
ncbi:ABC-type transporter Mla MlaB component [Streptomyces sp. B1I3]|nr:STAS domain-containing protein [Streptomyces sp. B1I3]MDQ0794389.1 ABC-type transporter Mla MlaB component [Streptomyces sp. B1I3]